MKTVKPLRVGVLTRPYGYQQQNRLGVLVYTLVDFTGAAPKLVPEAELTTRLIHQMDCEGILDLILPKAYPEFLVSGSAYTNHQTDRTRCAIRIQVANLDKSLIVSGDRYWVDNRITPPQPFEHMPITWANAFGGRDFAENPAGKGLDRELINGVWTTRLPNIESPTDRIHTRGQLSSPAGTSPIFLTRPRRYGHIGNISDSWMKNDITSFLPDMDPRLFNAAEPDQRWTDRSQLPLGAPFAIWNMHPEDPCWTGVIPDWVARCFVQQQRGAQGHDFLEVDLRPTTIWFLPHIKHAVMMYHGSTPVEQTYGEDITAIIPAIERHGQARSIDYYRQIFDQRNDMETGALYALRDKDLVPKALMGDWLDTKPLAENALMRNAQKHETIQRREIRQKIEQQNQSLAQEHRLDIADVMPTLAGPPFPQGPEHFPELHQRMQKLKQDTELQMEREYAQAQQKARDKMPATSDPQIQDSLRLLTTKPTLPARETVKQAFIELDKQQDTLEREWEKARKLNAGTATAQDIEKTQTLLKNARIQLGKMNLYTAHFMESGAVVSRHAADLKRDAILSRYDAGDDLKGLDMTGANLSGTVFSDADFTGADLSDADLHHARFVRCNLSETILVRAAISHTTFDECHFSRSNLGATTIQNSDFRLSRFDNVTIHKSEFSQCDFRDSLWTNTLFNTGACFRQCHFGAAKLEKTIFTECTFDDVSFHAGTFSQVVFQQSTLSNVNFEMTVISGAAYIASKLQKLNFSRARLEGVSFMYKLSLDTCSFNLASLKGCCFKGTTVVSLTARESQLSHCDFSGSSIPHTDFTRATLHQCVFKGSDLRQCVFRAADLTASILQQADLRGADMTHTNLCTADISETHMDESTIVRHVYVQHAKRYPLRKGSMTSWERHA